MGYRVHLSYSEQTENLCEKLSESPAELFDKPFFGYLLFLLTGHEKELLAELSSRFGEFEQLCRDTFAYLIVARETPIPVEVEWEPEAYVRSFASRDSVDIQRKKVELKYVKLRGLQQYGNLFEKSTHGELLAISDAVNEVARWFGVTPRIPCMLVFDALPQDKPTVVPLDQFTVTHLIEVFRKVVGRLSGADYREQVRTIRRIGDLHDEYLAPVEVPAKPTIEAIRAEHGRQLNVMRSLVALMAEGSSKANELRRTDELPLTGSIREVIRTVVIQTYGQRKKLIDALKGVDRCIAVLGTGIESEVKPKRYFRRTLVPLLPANLTLKVPETDAEWSTVKLSLHELLEAEINKLPSPAALEQQLEEQTQHEFQARTEQYKYAEQRAKEAAERSRLTEAERKRLLEDFLSSPVPSFSTIVREELDRAGREYLILDLVRRIVDAVTNPKNIKWVQKVTTAWVEHGANLP